MPSFRDRNGNTHFPEVLICTIDQINRALNVNILELDELARLSQSPLQQCELLWIASGQQGTLEAFTESMTLETIEQGMDAFILAFCDFLPARQSIPLQAAHERAKLLRAKLTATAAEILKQSGPVEPEPSSLLQRLLAWCSNLWRTLTASPA